MNEIFIFDEFFMSLFSIKGFASNDMNYPVTWFPAENSDWDIVDIVKTLNQNLPVKFKNKLMSLNQEKLYNGIAFTYEQDVFEFPQDKKRMSVEYSTMLLDIPYEEFIAKMPADTWGINLMRLLGGEVIVYERDEEGRPILQLERMVLSPSKLIKFDTPFNMDMTKVEVIKYEENKSTVFWRVMSSDNDSTESDIGNVEFKKYDENSTLVTFHSAHRLKFPWGMRMNHFVVRSVLKTFFLGHIKNYHLKVKMNSSN